MASKSLKPGVHRIPEAEYHADPAPAPSLSSGIARALLARSPRHAWIMSPRLNPEWAPVEKKAFDLGRAGHRAVLGVGTDYIEIPAELLSEDEMARAEAEALAVADTRG